MAGNSAIDTWGARALKDIMVNENNQQNHIGTFLYLTQVKAVLFTVISATSYYQFLGSTPLEITCMWWLWSATLIHIIMRKYRCTHYVKSIWQHDEKVYGVNTLPDGNATNFHKWHM